MKADIRKQLGFLDLRMKELEKEMLKGGKKGWSTATSNSGSDISTSAGVSSVGMPPVTAPAAAEAPKKKTWKPSCIFIQGYCTDWTTRAGALPERDVDVFLKDFFDKLEDADKYLANLIDRPTTIRKGGFNFRLASTSSSRRKLRMRMRIA